MWPAGLIVSLASDVSNHPVNPACSFSLFGQDPQDRGRFVSRPFARSCRRLHARPEAPQGKIELSHSLSSGNRKISDIRVDIGSGVLTGS